MARRPGSTSSSETTGDSGHDVDVVVVGAGFSGLYLLYRLRQLGFSARAFDEADDVGGTWYWNRYPGARCDIPTTDYVFSFDPELEDRWQWSEKYATQPEILAYLRFVADRHDLRHAITFATKVTGATWDVDSATWTVRTSAGEEVTASFVVMATGCLSVPKEIDIPGAPRFQGERHWTSRWPHEGVDVTGKKVAVIGTGSSGIQCIPHLAAQAASLTVFQRTANFSVPAHHGPMPPKRRASLEADRSAYRHAARWSRGGVPTEPSQVRALAADDALRRQRFEEAWEAGELFAILNVFADQGIDLDANEVVAEMIRERIRAVVANPETADALCPRDHPFGTKRPCLDSDYFATYNLPHVHLVDLRREPIVTVTEDGIETSQTTYPLDVIVYATGFDAMTGALEAVDLRGRDGVRLRERWADGPSTYLGLTTRGFPNLFTITGPGSPSVLSNMAVSIEQHVEWVTDCLAYLRAHDFTTIEPTETAEAGWAQHMADCAAITLHPRANSWYMGANVPGKPRTLYPYIGGVDRYRGACDEVAARGYLGFELAGPGRRQCHDAVVRAMQPDVAVMVDTLAQLGFPPLETLPVPDARGAMALLSVDRPPGPQIGSITDGVLPGAAGDLPYRCYRPATSGRHAGVVYFHGGGWVLGDLDSDDPLCRDLCQRLDAVVISVNYRHAPEARYPAAADDAEAAVRAVAAQGVALGIDVDRLAVAGWSAGGNLAAVACQRLRDHGGPPLAGQLLLCPVVDFDLERASYQENGEGYVLTTAMMRWFWDLYADPEQRAEPSASPIRGELAGLPPAVVVTADYDPLRDEGRAYGDALRAAGVPVVAVRARGHTHTSVPMVDLLPSGAPVRAEMAAALQALLVASRQPTPARS